MIVQKLYFDGPVSKDADYSKLCNCIEHLSIISSLVLHINDSLEGEVPEIVNFLKPFILAGTFAFQGIPITSDALSGKLLDAGLHTIIFDPQGLSTEEVGDKLAPFPADRVGISLPASAETTVATIQTLCGVCHHFSLSFSEEDVQKNLHLILLPELLEIINAGDHRVKMYLSLPLNSLSMADVATLSTRSEHLHTVLVPRINLKGTKANEWTYLTETLDAYEEGDVDLIDAFIACLRTDRVDGLYTTVVCDEHLKCLGLVYSNQESIRCAILEKRGIYYSRSRHTLWRKGDASGMHQSLLQIKVDCDQDALQFIVKQHGTPPSFCHTMTRSCFGEDTGLTKLQTMLFDRKYHAPVGSYTKRLFEDDHLLKQKLFEEIQELVEAETTTHIAEEAADVMYFVLTRCVKAGVTIQDIEKQLDLRSLKIVRRPGNAKEWRTKEAEKILNKKIT